MLALVTPGSLLSLLAALLVVQRGAELALARRNERWARSRGAREFGGRHYRWFFVLHGAWFLAFVAEAWLRGLALADAWPLWAAMIVAAQVIRYAAVATLGRRWNTRVLVVPGLPPVRGGIYRYLAHPNYLAVILEFIAIPALFGAYAAALVMTALNLVLLLRVRIPLEERALGWAASQPARVAVARAPVAEGRVGGGSTCSTRSAAR